MFIIFYIESRSLDCLPWHTPYASHNMPFGPLRADLRTYLWIVYHDALSTLLITCHLGHCRQTHYMSYSNTTRELKIPVGFRGKNRALVVKLWVCKCFYRLICTKLFLSKFVTRIKYCSLDTYLFFFFFIGFLDHMKELGAFQHSSIYWTCNWSSPRWDNLIVICIYIGDLQCCALWLCSCYPDHILHTFNRWIYLIMNH